MWYIPLALYILVAVGLFVVWVQESRLHGFRWGEALGFAVLWPLWAIMAALDGL